MPYFSLIKSNKNPSVAEGLPQVLKEKMMLPSHLFPSHACLFFRPPRFDFFKIN
jgi:hypothetical protein